MSVDYFTTRRDRYIIFKNSPELSNYLDSLLKVICSHSFHASCGGENSIKCDVDPTMEPARHKKSFEHSIRTIIEGNDRNSSHSITNSIQVRNIESYTVQPDSHTHQADSHADTFVFPLLQMGLYNIKQEERVTREILSGSTEGDRLYMASGYFNLPPQYSSAIISSKGEYHVLAASPQVRQLAS